MARLIATLAIVFTFLSACTKKEQAPYTGTFPTEMVRTAWHGCFNAIQKVMPQAPPMITFSVCDCVVDETRGKYDVSMMKNPTIEQQRELTEHFGNASKMCIQKTLGTLPSTRVM